MRQTCIAVVVAACLTMLAVATISPAARRTAAVEPTISIPANETIVPLVTPTATPAGVVIRPTDNAQSIVNSRPAGTTFQFAAGVHRTTSFNGTMVQPRTGDTFIGDPGAVLNGARLLAAWVSDGARWRIDGQTQPQVLAQGEGQCESPITTCHLSEDLFVDGVPLMQEASLASVGPGEWYFDYAADRIYIGDNPAGRVVEVSAGRHAFACSCNDVTIRGLTIEKFASPAQHGAVDAGASSSGWVVENNVIQLNHGAAIDASDNGVIRNNRILRNGQLGLHGAGVNDTLVEGNEIAYNNFAGFSDVWEAGGFKFAADGTNVTFRNNHSHHNIGPGMWTDFVGPGTVYEGNLVEWNTSMGIEHEISLAAVIRNNTVRYNSTPGADSWGWGGQIVVQNSSNVEVYGNSVTIRADAGDGIVVIQQNRSYAGQPRAGVDNYIHHNEVWHLGSVGQNGIFADTAGLPQPMDPESAWTRNRFDFNTYHVPQTSGARWTTRNSGMSWSAFRAAGHEANGSADTSVTSTDCSSAGTSNADGNLIDLSPPKNYDDISRPNSDLIPDACDNDDDNDGRTDAMEASGGNCGASTTPTNALQEDSDADLVIDGAECAFGTDPANSASTPSSALCHARGDADADGVADAREVCFFGTSAAARNTDGDALEDSCEIASVNADLVVNTLDLQQVSQHTAHAEGGYLLNMDVNRDGYVNVLDTRYVASRILPCS